MPRSLPKTLNVKKLLQNPTKVLFQSLQDIQYYPAITWLKERCTRNFSWIQHFCFLGASIWWKPEQAGTNDNNVITFFKYWKMRIITSALSDMKLTTVKCSWSSGEDLSCGTDALQWSPPQPWHEAWEWERSARSRWQHVAAWSQGRSLPRKSAGSLRGPQQLELKGCRYNWIPTKAFGPLGCSF